MTSKVINSDEPIYQFLEYKNSLSESSLKNYRATLLRFNKFCNSKQVTFFEVDESHVGEFLKPYTYKKTQESYKKILSSFYKWAQKKGHINFNPTEDVKVRGTKKQQKLMTYKEFKRFLNNCGGLRESTIINFLWYTGVRTREIIEMRFQDIDLVNDIIYVGFSKTENGIREIPIHTDLKFTLKKYIKKAKEVRELTNNSSQILFLNKNGDPIRERTLQHMISKLQHNFGGKHKWGAHDFRRAFVTNVYNETRDIVLAQELAGHASVETTRKYIITNGNDRYKKFKSLKLGAA